MVKKGVVILLEDGGEKQSADVAVLNVERNKSFTDNVWLADSAASPHFCTKDIGLKNVQMITSPVKIGNSKVLYTTKVGDL